MSESFFADYFSSREEVESMPCQKKQTLQVVNQFKELAETKSEPGSEEILNEQDNCQKVPEVTPPRRTKARNKRKKRGDSLERNIAKLFLSEEFEMHCINMELNVTQTISVKEILMDLVVTSETIASPPSQSNPRKNNEAEDCKKSEDADFDDTTALCHFAEERTELLGPRELFPKSSSDSDAFDFDANDNEWAVFEDCSAFGTEINPTNGLDGDGFPLSVEEKSDEEDGIIGKLDEKVSLESTSIEATSKKEEETSKVEETSEVDHNESPSVISSGDKSIQSESRTALLDANENLKGKSYDFESKQSPSSVANFPAKEGLLAHRTVGPYMLKRRSNAVQNLHWNPKPPEHYKQPSFILYQPGDTLS